MPCSNTGQFCYKDVIPLAKRETLAKRYEDLAYKLKRKAKGINKRGYTIILPEQPEKVTQSAFKKLQKIYENIYEFARYYDPLQDKFIKGTERRLQERQIAARKGWETRRAREAMEFWDEHRKSDTESFADIVKREREEKGMPKPDFTDLPLEEETIFNTVYDWIEHWEESPLWSSELSQLKREDRNLLKSVIDGAVAELGKLQVCLNLKGKTAEYMGLVQEVLYASGTKFKDDGRQGIQERINRIAAILWGRPLTVDESIVLTNISERMNEYE